MNMKMKIHQMAAALAIIASLVMSSSASAAAPGCYAFNGAGYCQYTGRAYQVYVNSNGEIILYFDTAMPASAPSSVGIAGVSVFGATLFRTSTNPDYAKMLYASLLSAQARGATITVQMWGVENGYMKLDRVWVNE
jgi:hypothetical protein